MALKHELSKLYRNLISKAHQLPPKVKNRTITDIESIFTDYESINSDALLEDIKIRAQNKLVILDMSLPEPSKTEPKDIPGVKKYHMKDGKLTEGAPASKFKPDYSNWYAGNVDPQDLKRHKELLDRQHFMGPFWEGRPRNPSILDEESPRYHKVDPEKPPPEEKRRQKESESFEYVKR